MDRREAVQRVALILGGTVLGADLFLQTGCKPKSNDKHAGIEQDFFTAAEIAFLDEVAETIIPRTDTPGAKDAKVGETINILVRDSYGKDDQKIFRDGMKTIDKLSRHQYGADFMKLDPAQRTELLTQLDKEQKEHQQNKKEEEPRHYFRMMRELTLLAFFTSEPGATKVLRYAAVPGKYEPCIPYAKGDGAWATN